ncbi:hypothetical protein DYH56_05170 [Psychrilyobacter piezotolerans]|uniref:Uncharacterized protein n=1 Tax=Psychrilyobacter piezotolerans TaxID=2293438 RepID=A0ABX9KJ25_9FUSO|nr:hypothetical protein DV867_05170 [Psychrilyobacter sp. S5]REI42113.1 hypothetical protein DYH56_05170 [Psychrilyobacter piezotolerans]
MSGKCRWGGLKIKGLEFKVDPIHHKTKLFQFKIFRRADSIRELFLGRIKFIKKETKGEESI